jgi:SET domain-containing protein
LYLNRGYVADSEVHSRLINHACDPNCTAKIITIGGQKKIVIYAKIDIHPGDEVTYDYHFPIENEKVRALPVRPGSLLINKLLLRFHVSVVLPNAVASSINVLMLYIY